MSISSRAIEVGRLADLSYSEEYRGAIFVRKQVLFITRLVDGTKVESVLPFDGSWRFIPWMKRMVCARTFKYMSPPWINIIRTSWRLLVWNPSWNLCLHRYMLRSCTSTPSLCRIYRVGRVQLLDRSCSTSWSAWFHPTTHPNSEHAWRRFLRKYGAKETAAHRNTAAFHEWWLISVLCN